MDKDCDGKDCDDIDDDSKDCLDFKDCNDL